MQALETSPTPSQAVFNGQIYLQGQCPKILGISPGNPHYYKTENLQRLLGIAQNNLDKVNELNVSQLFAVMFMETKHFARKS